VAKRLAIAIGVLLLLLAAAAGGFLWWMGQAAGDPAFFEREIAAFEAADAAAPPRSGGIVFAGSSSIRLWDTLEEDVAPLPVIQRGFGGAHMEHVVHTTRRIVTRYAPRAVVVFVGGNDITSGKTSARVASDFRAFLDLVHAELPEADVWLLSMKPSKLRWGGWGGMKQADALLRRYADADPRIRFVETDRALLGPDGTPDDVYIFDGLHLNRSATAAGRRS
jgi:hypothetical protein